MFQRVTQTFGDMLYYPKSDFLSEFPSPEALKYRIILSTKPPREYMKSKPSEDRERESQGDSWGKEEASDLRYLLEYDEHDSEQDDKDDTDDGSDNNDGMMDKNSLHDSSPEYRQLITITAGKPKGGLQEALKVDPNKVRRLSLSEQELERATKLYGKDIVRY